MLNDDHNTFDHVAKTLSRVIPGVSLDQGHRLARSGPDNRPAGTVDPVGEPAELYWEQLSEAGLTMAPLEQH